MARVVSEAPVVPSRSAHTERPSRPTGLHNDGGFASMLDEARPDPGPAEKTQAQPRDRVKPVEKTKASSETQMADKPATSSQDSLASGEAAPAASKDTPPLIEAAAAAELAPTLDGTVVTAPADGATDETLDPASDALVTQPVTTEAPATVQVDVPTTPPAAPAAAVPPADTTLAAPNAPPADLLAKPAPAVPTPPQAAQSASAPEAPSAPAPLAQQAPAVPAQPLGASAPEAAEPEVIAPPAKTAGTDTMGGSGKAETKPAEATTAQPVNAGTDGETAMPPDGPKQAKPAPAQAAAVRQDSASSQPGPEQPDAASTLDDAALAAKPNIDPSTNAVQLTTPAHTHAATAPTQTAAPVSAAQPIPVNAVAVEIAAQARAGNSRFEIRLDPPELGRIDVRLDIDNDGNVKSRLIVERADTYDLLRRDQSTLERALQQAGLKTSDNALEFSLRDQGFAQQRRDADDQPRVTNMMINEAEVASSEAAQGYARLLGARGGIDIRV